MNATSQSMISVRGLRKSYKDKEVLKGVDFEVAPGEIFCLLGSNGAGKTTAVNILTTLGKAHGGSASINGFDVATQPAYVRASISLTGQYAAVDQMFTGSENLQLIAQLRRLKNPKKQAEKMLEIFRLSDAADKLVSEYSGGMRRRLDIAMTLLGDSPVIFLDEPTTGLDPQSRIGMWKLIAEKAANGTTIFLTTQYLEEAEQLADKVAILHEGVVAAYGTPDELKGGMRCETTGAVPTLEDVFLNIIGEEALAATLTNGSSKEGNNEDAAGATSKEG